MARNLKLSLVFLFFLSFFIFPFSSTHALEPFLPFSVEGNPDEAYQFSEIFPLFTYIKPAFFQVYENRDYSRDYQHLAFCPGGDRRDYQCAEQDGVEIDPCEGGEVDLCHIKANEPTTFAYTATSKHGNCKIGRVARELAAPGTVVNGKCEYTQVPKISSEIKGTDFSAPTDLNPEGSAIAGLTYPKLQNEALRFGNFGTDNAITWGSHFLAYNQCDRSIHQLLVVYRAGETKKTLAETGEWPLGWVDWGYVTRNGKTLFEIRQELPGSVAGAGRAIAEGVDDFFLNAGNLDAVSDISHPKEVACEQISTGIAKKETWALDLAQTPLYSPSFRQGFVRGSICIWDLCCPGLRCPIDHDSGLVGNSKSLYYDISVSQAFGAALDDILLYYPLDQAAKIFRRLAAGNQLIRFATSASTQAIPSVIRARLDQEIKDPCFEYRPNPFLWKNFGIIFDYLDSDHPFLDPEEKCPGYRLQPNPTKEHGGAFPESFLQRLINLLWRGATGRAGGKKVDEVEPVKYHLLTVPDAMGQSISLIEQQIYDTRDTLSELDKAKEHNASISNIVDDNADYLAAGKAQPIANSQRFVGLYSCGSGEYSSPQETSIEAYALGTRIGCDQQTFTDSTCDGIAFGTLLNSNPYGKLLDKATQNFGNMRHFLTPELLKVYAEASAKTGVPCEILAGIHFVEADLNPHGSLISGRTLGTPEPDAGNQMFNSLLDTAIYAGEHLKGKVSGQLNNFQKLTTALSRYNGGGNSNCQQGYPWAIPYSGCPRRFEGEDDPYPINWVDNRHSTMYLLYCADSTACEPQVWERPGALTFALTMYENMTKNGAIASEVKDTPLTSSPPSAIDSGGPFQPFMPTTSCGPNSLSTALGCLSYGDSLPSLLLSFIIGIAGAIALVIMLFGTVQIMTSGGNAEKLRKGKELFIGAIIGLLFIIFSVTLLKTLAGDIIKLPGFY